MNQETKKSQNAQREEEVLKFWKENNIFQRTLEKESPKGEFVFYEGPPTANGKPGIHHIEARSFKDIIPRFKTMQGFHVRRKGGWDTHGLPVELQVEKALGLKSKKEIENYGIEEFNKKCKESVWEYTDLWGKFTDRIGYWVDQENPYITYENKYIESVWNIVKTVNEKGLLYKDYKVLPWCPRCGTALSSHELAQGYQDDKDLSVTAKFKVLSEENTFILAWTTTPWTLPGNVALAVGENIDYVKIKQDEQFLILAKERLSVVEKEYELVSEMKGSDLVGLKYEPLYPFLKEKFESKNTETFSKAFQVYSADFVTTTDGTGVVHTAVMYGQDDFVLGTQIGLPKFHLVKDDGHFLDGMDFLSSRFVKDEEVAVDIIKDLAHRGLLFKKEKYEHSYPHCWRCKTPLIYYARDSWYIAMSKLRNELVSENEGINWEPDHIKEGRFGEWLREIKDWAISRERYWGTPLPAWLNSKGEIKIIGSIEELKSLSKKSGNKYYAIRHGEGEHNVKNILSSYKDDDFHLTEKGKEQVRKSVEELKDKGITKIFSSPFVRTKETTEIIKEVLGLSDDAVIYDDRLGEHCLGELSGKPVDVYHNLAHGGKEVYEYTPKDGENLLDVIKRTGDFLYEVDEKYSSENILLVTHEHTFFGLDTSAQGLDKKQLINLFDNSPEEYIKNAEIRGLNFSKIPHNENYELDLHRPFIDNYEVYLDGEKLTRSKEVMDVWFDSGSMPFAQDNYPFSTKDIAYPADFISEAIDQTRGWFYTLHAIGVLMGRGKAFKNVICLGHILDSQGKKMSKSLGNIVDPWEQMDKFGVDALRFWMFSVNQPGDSKNFDEKTVDEIVKKVFNPLENILSLYETYKGDFVLASDESQNVLDRWIISRLNETIAFGTAKLENYKLFESTRIVRDFVNDFSTWFVRRSRERLKSDNQTEREEALKTTKFVLLNLVKYMAPLTPFFAEYMYQKLNTENSKESVHLESWPEAGKVDVDLLSNMQKIRETVSALLDMRQKANIKVRQPLQSVTLTENMADEFLNIIKDELNVKEILIGDTVSLDTNLSQELIDEGFARDVIRAIQDARKTEKLTPSDEIEIKVNTDKEEVFKKYEQMITSPTGVTKVSFDSSEMKYKVDTVGSTSFSILR